MWWDGIAGAAFAITESKRGGLKLYFMRNLVFTFSKNKILQFKQNQITHAVDNSGTSLA